ncbi:hypothetical protein G6F31_020281 [Rhizopus arrhizus]|nr:hypothetical protein G6F31_020281 [Rhizopus arrhizus]
MASPLLRALICAPFSTCWRATASACPCRRPRWAVRYGAASAPVHTHSCPSLARKAASRESATPAVMAWPAPRAARCRICRFAPARPPASDSPPARHSGRPP